MYCGNCGRQIENTSNVCPYCGIVIDKGALIENRNKYEDIFVDPRERYLGALGDGYINSFLTNKEMEKCIAILSDRRVYLRGNMIDFNQGKFGRYNMQKTIDLEDITGTGFVYTSSSLWKLIVALFLLVLIITAILLGKVEFLIILIIPAILLMVSYFIERETLFFIEYAGGCIKFDASIYSLEESKDFEKQIRRAKNAVKGY